MKILFLVTEDWYFWSHRLGLARKIRRTGAEVFIMTRVNQLGPALQNERFGIIPWKVCRGSLNPGLELSAFSQVLRVYRDLRPDLVHHVALKPVVYGGLAAQMCAGLPAVNAIAGLGETFIGQSKRMVRLRRVLLPLLRLALRGENSRTVVQNTQNRNLLIEKKVESQSRISLIRGTGVDPDEFIPRPEPSGVPIVLLAARMLWTKGIGEFVEAARIVRQQGVQTRFVLVGRTDSENPSGIPVSQLRGWTDAGAVEWWGHRDDMANVLAGANVVCLPSYGEGLPKVLVEAAACERAIVTTDTPGCSDVVRNNDNGLLVPVEDSQALANAITTLLKDPAMRAKMARRGREIAIQEFSERNVIQDTFSIYRGLLGARWPESAMDPAADGASAPAIAQVVDNTL